MQTLISDLGFGWPIYTAFLVGKVPADLFKRIADNHCWVTPETVPFDSGYPIDVFDGETLFIRDPEATELLKLFL